MSDLYIQIYKKTIELCQRYNGHNIIVRVISIKFPFHGNISGCLYFRYATENPLGVLTSRKHSRFDGVNATKMPIRNGHGVFFFFLQRPCTERTRDRDALGRYTLVRLFFPRYHSVPANRNPYDSRRLNRFPFSDFFAAMNHISVHRIDEVQ